ncbi:MAG: hypothetical protein ABIN79_06220 [Marmoricola sp.]
MFGTSMLVTVGQTLEHARDVNVSVRLYIGGEWVTGRVLHTDGHGVAIATEDGDTCVIRLDAVSCVRIPTPGTGRVEDVEQRVPSQPRNAGQTTGQGTE